MERKRAWRIVSNRVYDKVIPTGATLWVDVAAHREEDAVEAAFDTIPDDVKVARRRPVLIYDPDHSYATALEDMGGMRVVRASAEIRDEVCRAAPSL